MANRAKGRACDDLQGSFGGRCKGEIETGGERKEAEKMKYRTEEERLVRCAEQREKAHVRSKAYYLEHRAECSKKTYLRRLPGIKKPKEATLRLHGLTPET